MRLVPSQEGRLCEVVEETESGGFITRCELVIAGPPAQEGVAPTCEKCDAVNNPQKLVPQKFVKRDTRRKRRSYGRVGRKPTSENVGELLNFSNKAIASAIEWHNRGRPSQFLENVLDQANMAVRFLQEILLENGRELPDPEPFEEDDE